MANYGEFINGIGVSESETRKFDTMVNIDIHSTPGKAQCSKAFEDLDTGEVATSLPTCKVELSNGDTFFGAGTQVIKVSSSTVSLVHTSTQGAVLGLGEHKGYLYYATATKLGRIQIANASSESTWSSHSDSWATFSNQYAYKPMVWVNQVLCIGDGNYIAMVDETSTFLANALDILERDVVTALHNMNDYLAIGTFVNSAVHQSSFYNWDTYSPSWTEDYKVSERGVNMFFEIDGYTYAQVGSIGNIYQWTGDRAVLFLRLRDGVNTVQTSINPYGTADLNGLRLIATKRGLFSFGRSSATLPVAMVIEYVGSEGQGAMIGAVAVMGSDVLSGFQNGSTYGIDHISTNYATGHIITPEVDGKKDLLNVLYTKMPSGCSITSEVSIDGGSYDAHTLVQDDEDDRVYYSDAHIDNKSIAQAKVILNPSGATTPVIKNISL